MHKRKRKKENKKVNVYKRLSKKAKWVHVE
jgi:hypothetical protein